MPIQQYLVLDEEQPISAEQKHFELEV